MILQAAGARISKTEYIACPSCGRTHFDILSRLKEIRQATSHLTTLKIGVMGCIVNGPGEMADADYGYVGAGPGKVSIYKGKKAMLQNIAEEESLEALIAIMKKEGDWIDP
jgi:(E)-4-hydroxy-3-methylbut-2-enyl-diphosphate synthase